MFRYQQAIADWQAWADNQNSEFSNLQVTLTQYIEAYNTVTAELAQLQAAQPAEDGNGQKDEEIAKLKASVRAKGIEIEDLVIKIFLNYKTDRYNQVVIAQWLAWRPATGEVPGLNPGKGENLLISDQKGNLIYSNLNTIIVWVFELTGLV